MDKPSTVVCKRSCNSWPLVSFSSSMRFCASVAMSTRVRNKALARLMRSDNEAKRCALEATVAMAGDKRRFMNSPMVCVPEMGDSRNSAMRSFTSLE